jgi:aldehyde dehydrogenase (NAD+)
VVEDLRKIFNTGKTKPLEWRIEQLEQTIRMLTETGPKMVQAVAQDLHRV